jgi:hypothetical protein
VLLDFLAEAMEGATSFSQLNFSSTTSDINKRGSRPFN